MFLANSRFRSRNDPTPHQVKLQGTWQVVGPAIEARLPFGGGKRLFFFFDGRPVPESTGPVQKTVPERIIVEETVKIRTEHMSGSVDGSIQNLQIVPRQEGGEGAMPADVRDQAFCLGPAPPRLPASDPTRIGPDRKESSGFLKRSDVPVISPC